MFRCFVRPKARAPIPARWLPSLAGPGSRGIKLSKLSSVSLDQQIPRSVLYHSPFTNEGRKHLAGLLSNDIGLYTELKQVWRLDRMGIQLKTAPRHVVHLRDLRYFTEIGHAFAEAIVRRHLDNQEKPLWVFTSALGADVKPIVRGKAKYRINVAMRQALRNTGYDVDGRRLSEEELQKQSQLLGRNIAREPGRRDVARLFGTCELMIRDCKELDKMAFADLLKHCEKVVRHLEEDLGQAADGSKANVASTQRPRPQNHSQQSKQHNGSNKGRANEKPKTGGQKRQQNR